MFFFKKATLVGFVVAFLFLALTPRLHANVAFGFDDTLRSQITRGLPKLRGLPATWYTLDENINMPWGISVTQLRQLKLRGHVLAAHSCTHPDFTLIPFAEAQAEIECSVRRMIARGLGDPAMFAWPYGGTNEALQEYAAEWVLAARGTKAGIVTAASNLFDLPSESLRRDKPFSYYRDKINRYGKNPNVLYILVIHMIVPNNQTPPDLYDIQEGQLKEIVDYTIMTNQTVELEIDFICRKHPGLCQ